MSVSLTMVQEIPPMVPIKMLTKMNIPKTKTYQTSTMVPIITYQVFDIHGCFYTPLGIYLTTVLKKKLFPK